MPSLDENKALWDGGYDWGAGGDEWSGAWGGVSSQWWTTLFPRLQGYLPAHTVLEIAPGFGRWTHYLKDLCSELVLVDISAKAIEHCKQRFAMYPHVSAHVNDGTSLAMVTDGPVDLAFSFDALVHVEMNVMDAYLEEIARVLSPDGVAFLHHSNVGAHTVGTYDPSVTHWRGQSVSAASVEAASGRVGLSCVSQELLGWGTDQLLTDCISVITRQGSRWDRTTVICENMSFKQEIALAKQRSELYPPQPTNLCLGIPRLIGRSGELQLVRDAVLGEGARLVTITGPGGVGKTSVALVVAEEVLDVFPGGVWLVRLASVGSPDDVLPAIEAALGGESDASEAPFDAIVRRLHRRGKTLVVLDSFEHLLAGALSVGELVEAVPGLSVLVTSHAPLRLAAERLLAIGSLDSDAALSLIAHAARQRGVRLSTDPQQRDALAEVARLVDGLPLALELAAACLSQLTPRQLADRLHSSVDVLREEPGHRALRATVQGTLDSLEAPGRELFVRLGAFAGAVELAEIGIIAGADGLDVVDALSGLVDVALVRRVESGDSRVRFGLPEPLRRIASAMPDETSDGARWREAHMRRQYEVLWEARARIGTITANRAAVEADLEAAAALRWALDTGHSLSPWIAAIRAALNGGRGRLHEAQALLDPLLASLPEDRDLRAYVRLVQAWLLSSAGQIDDALRAADSALTLASDRHVQGAALKSRGVQLRRAGRFDEAIRDHERFTALARSLGAAELANALITESQSRIVAGELERGTALLAEAERIEPSSDALGIWSAHTVRADLALLLGRPLEAAVRYARSLEIAQQQRDDLQVRLDLIGVADALAMSGHDEDALEVAGIVEAHGDDLGIDRGTQWYVGAHDRIPEAARRLDNTAAERALAQGRAVPAGERVPRAVSVARRAYTDRRNRLQRN